MLARLAEGDIALRHRAQGRPAGPQPRRRRRDRDGDPPSPAPARVGQREHRRDAERPPAARHHELDRRVLLGATCGRRSRRARPQKAKRGGTPFRAPIGYVNVARDRRRPRDPHHRASTPTADRSSPKPSSCTPAATTRSPSSAPILEARGLARQSTRRTPGRALGTNRLADLLRNDYYIGILRYAGKVYKGRHEPLVELSDLPVRAGGARRPAHAAASATGATTTTCAAACTAANATDA